MRLLIAIPALDEEESIAEVIQRSLAARSAIIAATGVTAVEVTVVSDGSTDRTVERAAAFGDRIKLLVFDRTRGYGAAIKEAWAQSDAELLGFLDADGTYDPAAFAGLCRHALEQNADIVMGCRLNRGSRMPGVRWVGNALFAMLLSVFAGRRVRDTATGMRVVRCVSLARLLPLPDGLNFTPAMTARAVLCGDVKIVEVDIPYGERQGTSKLQLINDGLRFLRVIVDAGLLYRPARLLCVSGVLFALASGALIPALFYLDRGTVQEWMGQRLVGSLALVSTCLLLSSLGLARKASPVLPAPPVARPTDALRDP